MRAVQAKAKPISKADKASAASSRNRNGQHQTARQKTTTPARLGAFYAASPAFSLDGPVQAKLEVGSPDDAYEQEADQVAETVMRMPQAGASDQLEKDEQPGTLAQTKPVLQRMCAACEADMKGAVQRQADEPVEEETDAEKTLQAKDAPGPSPQPSPATASRIRSIRGGGAPLAGPVRAFFEPHFGQDFSGVRIHTDQEAVQMSQELGAQAFTHGQDVYFNEGKFNPESSSGEHLLAHELTHVVQQNKK